MYFQVILGLNHTRLHDLTKKTFVIIQIYDAMLFNLSLSAAGNWTKLLQITLKLLFCFVFVKFQFTILQCDKLLIYFRYKNLYRFASAIFGVQCGYYSLQHVKLIVS